MKVAKKGAGKGGSRGILSPPEEKAKGGKQKAKMVPKKVEC